MEKQALVRIYYNIGLTFDEIAFVLAQKHRIIVSKRQLKRITASLGLYRKKHHSDLLDVASYIYKDLRQSGQLHGYRWMHAKCIEKGFVVDQETVRLFIKCTDPEGVKCRTKRRLRRREYSNKGLNYPWHMDGYDKLNPYGICIHGCVDGFSRNIMWMEAYSTNNDPRVIAGYFVDTVRELHGCPRVLRADFGTENGIVRQIQIFLRDCEDNVTDAFLYGTSRCNQRIESW